MTDWKPGSQIYFCQRKNTADKLTFEYKYNTLVFSTENKRTIACLPRVWTNRKLHQQLCACPFGVPIG